MGKLVVLLIALPVAEVLLLLRLADAIGGWRTFLWVVATGLIGVQVARMAGWQVIAQSQKAISSATMPGRHVLNGALLLLAAALLIIPGVITDALAIALLVPWSRRALTGRLISAFERAVAEGRVHMEAAQVTQVEAWRAADRDNPNTVIDTEGETVESTAVGTDDTTPPRLNSQ